MVAAEKKRFLNGQADRCRKKTPARLWPLLVFSDVIFLGVVAYLLMARPRYGLFSSLVLFVDLHFTWIAVCIMTLTAMALFFAVWKGKQPMDELTTLSQQMGWTLQKRWGFPGGFGAFSFFGYGPYFTVQHRGLRLAFSPIIDEDGRESGLRFCAFHDRPLALGLVIKAGVGFFMEGRTVDEYRGVLSKKLGTGLQDVKAWAGDKEKAADLLSSPEVVKSLDGLKRELDSLNEQTENRLISRSSGFVISDRRTTLLLSKNHHLSRNLVDAVSDVAAALGSSDAPPVLLLSRAGDRAYKAVLVTLISLVAASLIWVVSDYLREIL